MTTREKPRSLSLAGKQVRHLFLVEGRAEEGLVNALVEVLPDILNSDILVKCLEGIKNLDAVLRSLVSEPEWHKLHSVTILLDADDDPQKRRDDVWNTLGQRIRLSAQAIVHAKQNNFVIQDDTRYAVWLNPGQGRPGRIEDLVLETIDPNCQDCIRQMCHKLSQQDRARTPSAKALLAVWIACRADQGLGLGTTFERGLIDISHPAFEPLKKLIRDQLEHEKRRQPEV